MSSIEYTSKLACGIATGTMHMAECAPCQDRTAKYHGAEADVIVLCDGAGSMPGSEEAAELVSGLLSKEIGDHFTMWVKEGERLNNSILSLCISRVSEKLSGASADCTLLLFSLSHEGKALCVHIGDGVIIGINKDEAFLLSNAENGEFINETFFLSSPNAADHIRTKFLSEDDLPDCVFLASDGASVSLVNSSGTDFGTIMHKMMSWISTHTEEEADSMIAQVLNQLFRSNTEDDMSLSIMQVME